jgi:hypothetical protein
MLLLGIAISPVNKPSQPLLVAQANYYIFSQTLFAENMISHAKMGA